MPTYRRGNRGSAPCRSPGLLSGECCRVDPPLGKEGLTASVESQDLLKRRIPRGEAEYASAHVLGESLRI